jgi:cyclic pyranopterin phosphate synthase
MDQQGLDRTDAQERPAGPGDVPASGAERPSGSGVATPALVDPFGRQVTYLRVSVTDRCDFRCTYCMPESMSFLPKSDVLTLEEIDRVASAFVRRGVRKLRLTGGEPLVRRGVTSLVRSLSRHLASGALDELTLTTNGSQLSRFAAELADAGVRRVNVSLDTLRPDRFAAITRGGRLQQVLEGVRAAKAAGLHVKINTVALRGVNDDEFDELVAWTGGEGHDLVFIETMPLGVVAGDRADTYLPLSELRRSLAQRHTLEPLELRTGGPARYVRLSGSGQRIGFITPLTHNFCEGCNRVRLTATGVLYLCLGQEDAADLRSVMRASRDEEALDAAIEAAIARKPKGHDFVIDRRRSGPAVPRHMSVTGG